MSVKPDQPQLEFIGKPWSELGPVKGVVVWTRCAGEGWAYDVAFRELSRQQKRLLVHLVARGLARQLAREAQQVKL